MILIKSDARSGKTLLQVIKGITFIRKYDIQQRDIHTNIQLDYKGIKKLDDNELIDHIDMIFKKRIEHQLVMIQDITYIFPHRGWTKKDHELLPYLWKDLKYHVVIMADCHLGSAIDIILREQSRLVVIPRYDKETDILKYRCVDVWNASYGDKVIYNASKWFPLYNTYN